jgi:hypothetical protein
MDERYLTPTFVSEPRAAFIRRAVLDAVDHGLLALGAVVRETIYWRIEESHQVKREEIPENLDGFYKALQQLLGRGAEVISHLIAKNLFTRLDLKFTQHENWTLVDYVHNAKAGLGLPEVGCPQDHLEKGARVSELSRPYRACSLPSVL